MTDFHEIGKTVRELAECSGRKISAFLSTTHGKVISGVACCAVVCAVAGTIVAVHASSNGANTTLAKTRTNDNSSSLAFSVSTASSSSASSAPSSAANSQVSSAVSSSSTSSASAAPSGSAAPAAAGNSAAGNSGSISSSGGSSGSGDTGNAGSGSSDNGGGSSDNNGGSSDNSGGSSDNGGGSSDNGGGTADNGGGSSDSGGGSSDNSGGSSDNGGSVQRVQSATFTDEINGTTQTVALGGFGTGADAGGHASLSTIPSQFQDHGGLATGEIIKNGQVVSQCGDIVSKNGYNGVINFAVPPSGTYTVELIAKDGSTVARYSFTLSENGFC